MTECRPTASDRNARRRCSGVGCAITTTEPPGRMFVRSERRGRTLKRLDDDGARRRAGHVLLKYGAVECSALCQEEAEGTCRVGW